MAHVQKFSASSAGKIIGHCERERSDVGEYLKYRTTSDIDITKTHLNYSFSLNKNDKISSKEKLQKRLQEVYILKRKDVNVMCDWVLTAPKEIADDEKRLKEFFSSSFEFLAKRYGKENLVSCNVHMDEATPHMHYCFVPVTYDKKKERYKVSAFEVLNRIDLKTFHADLEEHLHQTIGLEKGLIHSGVTKEQGGNKTIGQLKAESLEKETEVAAAALTDFQKQIKESVNKVKASKSWRTIETAVFERDNYDLAPSTWFNNSSVVKDFKIKKRLGKEVVEAPIEAFNLLFKLHELHFTWESLLETQKTLRDEIRALYDYDPEVIEKRFLEVQEKANAADRLYNQQLTLNEAAADLKERNSSLFFELNDLKTEKAKLLEKVQLLDGVSDAYDKLCAVSKKDRQENLQLQKELSKYEDMFNRFPDMAEQMKSMYQKQLQQEKVEQRKNKLKQHEKSWDFEL